MTKHEVTLAGKTYERTISDGGRAIYRVRRDTGAMSCLNPHTHRAIIRAIESALLKAEQKPQIARYHSDALGMVTIPEE